MTPILSVNFFATEAGSEPVREWLKDLSAQDRKTIGEDIKTVQFGWPLGMPLVDHIEGNGVRNNLQGGKDWRNRNYKGAAQGTNSQI